MKTLLICPNQANGIPVLADSRPTAGLPFLGESFLCYWLEQLASRGVTEVRLVTSDEVDFVEKALGNGTRWGINLEIFHEVRELDAAEARKRYRPAYETDWLPEDVIEADHLPGLPEHKLFSNYSNWFKGLSLWLPFVCQSKRIGLREIQPGVWVGHRTRVGANVKFQAPCWLGDHVRIAKDAVIGPFAFLEERVVVDQAAEIANSWVGPDTFVGALTQLKESLGWGSLLINWSNGSYTQVPDPFLMSSLVPEPGRESSSKRDKRAHGMATSPLVRPLESVISLVQKIQG
jgi:hypothetical protein